jgi:hypothetical protein
MPQSPLVSYRRPLFRFTAIYAITFLRLHQIIFVIVHVK